MCFHFHGSPPAVALASVWCRWYFNKTQRMAREGEPGVTHGTQSRAGDGAKLRGAQKSLTCFAGLWMKGSHHGAEKAWLIRAHFC